MQDKNVCIMKKDEINANEILPGGYARFYHTAHVSVAIWDFIADAGLPSHSHPHEQITCVVEGTFEMTLGEETYLLEAGTVVTIPPDVPHSGRAITACHLVDAFYPVREDFKAISEGKG